MNEVERTVDALKKDLINENGPQISTLRNYPFAILTYSPKAEFEMRRAVLKLTTELKYSGWLVHTVNIKQLILNRLRDFYEGDENIQIEIDGERLISEYDDPQNGLESIKTNIAEALEGPDGLARWIIEDINAIAEDADTADHTVVFVGQLGAMYPFLRLSSLLKLLADHTQGIPVVFLYPGTYKDKALSFLGEATPDADYRPRIYTSDLLVI